MYHCPDQLQRMHRYHHLVSAKMQMSELNPKDGILTAGRAPREELLVGPTECLSSKAIR